MSSARLYLKNSYALRNGMIAPWGTIQILSKEAGIPNPAATGLTVWSEKLVPYGGKKYHAEVSEDTIRVLDEDSSLLEEISHDEFLAVNRHEALVQDDGYLFSCLSQDPSFWQPWKEALKQATAGQKPGLLDNGPFVRVDEKFAGQKVIELSWSSLSGYSSEDHAAVFTKEHDASGRTFTQTTMEPEISSIISRYFRSSSPRPENFLLRRGCWTTYTMEPPRCGG